MSGLDGDFRTLKDAGKGGGVKRLDEIGLSGGQSWSEFSIKGRGPWGSADLTGPHGPPPSVLESPVRPERPRGLLTSRAQ